MDSTTVYDDDVVTWSEQQAAALRALASRPELSNAVDWVNVIEEIETLGRSEWKGVASKLRNALAHILKEVCDPDALSREAWTVETDHALSEARDDFRLSMRPHIDVDEVWAKAFRQAVQALRPYGVIIPPGIPARSPFTLDEILAVSFDHRSAVAKLHELITHRSNRTERTQQ